MIRRAARDTRGTASVELALALPMMLALMFVGMEAGHFFWTEHKLIKSVRDGARYAARLDIEQLCNGDTSVLSSDLEGNIQNITATGQIADGGMPKVPGWDPASVEVDPGCGEFVDTGMYTDLDAAGPIVTVSSGTVSYPSILGGLGVIDASYNISAEAHAAVMGI